MDSQYKFCQTCNSFLTVDDTRGFVDCVDQDQTVQNVQSDL